MAGNRIMRITRDKSQSGQRSTARPQRWCVNIPRDCGRQSKWRKQATCLLDKQEEKKESLD